MSQPKFVQFIHPGGEHTCVASGVIGWNKGMHQRKFMKSMGRYMVNGDVKSADLMFWGEWEPESRVLAEFSTPNSGYPRYLYQPYYNLPLPGSSGHKNTDPFIFGDAFHYTGCKQFTQRGHTGLRFLDRGSVILFGSCIRHQFVLDTVFVVSHWIEHNRHNYRSQLAGKVSDVYFDVTLSRWYQGEEPNTLRLYFGATPQNSVDGMFSFFPCLPYQEESCGFERPVIALSGLITDHLTQGQKFTSFTNSCDIYPVWTAVKQQVIDAGLELGVHAELPRRE